MKHLLTIPFLCFLLTGIGSVVMAQPSRIWATYIGDGYCKDYISSPPIGTTIGETIYAGNYIYLMGTTMDTAQMTTPGTYRPVFNKGNLNEAFIGKYDTLGQMVWGTYFGGSHPYVDEATIFQRLNTRNHLAIDNAGNLYMGGSTTCRQGIATANGFLPSFPYTDTFLRVVGYLAKFSNSGQLLWSTYFPDVIRDVACDNSGNVYITGGTKNEQYVATANSFKPALTTGDCQGFPTVDAFLVKFNTNGQRVWGTYYGGLQNDNGYSIGITSTNDVILAGTTASTDQIATPGTYQPTNGNPGCDRLHNFIVKFNSNGQRLWGTYYCDATNAGSANVPLKILCDKDNNAFYLGGFTFDANNIATPNTFQPVYQGNGDAFLSKFTNNGQLVWGTYYGGSGIEWLQTSIAGSGFNCNFDWPHVSISFNDAGEILFGSVTSSPDHIKTACSYNNADQSIGFMAKFNTQGQRLWGSYTDATAGITTLAAGKGNSFYVSSNTLVDGRASAGAPKTSKLTGHLSGLLAKFSDAFICPQRDITIEVTDSLLRVDPSFAGYTWYKNNVAATNNDSPVFNLTDSGTYYVVVQDSCGCTYTSKPVTPPYHHPTSINELHKTDFTFFPNPNNGRFTIQFNGAALMQNKARIDVADVTGRRVYQTETAINGLSSQAQVNLTALVPGMYSVKVTSGAYFAVFKIVKQ